MPHLRTRTATPLISQLLKWSPSVSIIGMRQCGKSTLAKGLATSYFSLDDQKLMRAFENGDYFAIESAKEPTVIDEIQKYPPLFDQVKKWIDDRKRPGRFLLTGSVRFGSRKGIKESLTGRTVSFELLPMTLEECHNIEPVSILSRLASQSPETFFKNYTEVFTPEQILTYIQKGGMPGICFLRSSAARNELWRAHLETVLDRDLNLILSSKFSFEKKEQLLRLLYEDPSNPKDYALLARLLSSSQPTVKALISAYEGLFLIRRHGPYFFPEDAGLAHTLAPDILNERLNLLLRYTYSRLLALTHYEMRGESKLQHFRTKGGAEVHFVLSTPSAVFGFVVDAGDGASEKSLKSLGSLGKTLKKRFIPCVIHMGKKAYLSSRTVFCIPWTWL